MKRLTLMRHGDARWKDSAQSDLERPLNRRGTVAAEAMARRLLELELLPDLLLVSPARRAQQTADIVARELALPARRVLREENLYLASAGDLLAAAHQTGPRVAHLMVIAHNPGLSDLLRMLAPADAQARSLGTAALCSLTFECEAWPALGSVPVQDALHASPPSGLFGLFA
ncbi:MAG TPA: histidine phosphatase family protein [Steroidobacteraceae bacterium]|nr:histidine phosphatase family protein [Steroidobacteraceae bacterium]